MTSADSKHGTTKGTDDVNDIRRVILSLLARCDMPWPSVDYDHSFEAICRTDAILRGYPMEGRKSLGPFIHMGVVMATTAYAHLTDISTKIFISHYTASLIYIDDVFKYNVDVVQEFNERFVMHKPQEDKVLDCFATLLRELPQHYNKVVSSLITTSTLNLVSAMSVEYETEGMAIQGDAYRYPSFSRALSGATEAYALFVFPSKLALPKFIQAIPELMVYLNQGNDILSFYKEELAGETVNYISLVAAQRDLSKLQALRDVSDVVVDAHLRTLEILRPQAAAIDAYRRFASGYLGFHSGLKRYKLDELKLQGSSRYQS